MESSRDSSARRVRSVLAAASALRNVLLGTLWTGLLLVAPPASATYWSVFNIEGESTIGADYVTYGSLADMLGDTNRTGVFSRNGFGANIVDAGSDGSTYWAVFNIEGESTIGADYVTYGSLADMLGDTNRTGVFSRNGFGANIVGSGSDGSTYWAVFNIEGESAIGADYVTYGSLADMLGDTNRTGVFSRNGFGANIVDAGSDGSTYWAVFNIEGESAIGADYVTYGSLADMLGDTNRTGVFSRNGFGANIVGSGSDSVPGGPNGAPEPSALVLAAIALVGLTATRRRAAKPRLRLSAER